MLIIILEQRSDQKFVTTINSVEHMFLINFSEIRGAIMCACVRSM